MRKISEMYQWSGGTDYRRTCNECRNCKKVKRGSRTIYKCLAYGDTASAASDWKASYIACRHFNKPVPEVCVMELGMQRQKAPEEQMDGQMSFEDFPEVMPE